MDNTSRQGVIFSGALLTVDHKTQIMAVLDSLSDWFVKGKLIEPGVIGGLTRRMDSILSANNHHLILINLNVAPRLERVIRLCWPSHAEQWHGNRCRCYRSLHWRCLGHLIGEVLSHHHPLWDGKHAALSSIRPVASRVRSFLVLSGRFIRAATTDLNLRFSNFLALVQTNLFILLLWNCCSIVLKLSV